MTITDATHIFLFATAAVLLLSLLGRVLLHVAQTHRTRQMAASEAKDTAITKGEAL